MVSMLGRNYARAIFELASEEGRADAVGEELPLVLDGLVSDPDARGFLASRVVGRPAKRRLVSAVFSGRVDATLLTFLLVLGDRGRTGLLPEIVEEYERLARRARGERQVTVWSPFPLGAEEQERMREALERRFRSGVILDVHSRPELIGGVVAESEGQEIELSLEHDLATLAERLKGKQ